MKFWLGVHRANWLAEAKVPTLISYRTLRHMKSLTPATDDWFQDSGGFTELDLNGHYETPPRQYAADTLRHQREIGRLSHAAIQDWICEPKVREKTGLAIADHQRLTIESWFDLNEFAPDVPWLPVLQGWDLEDYLRHADAWANAGVDLARVPLVGVGSVVSRQRTTVAAHIVSGIAALGIRLHAFGFKVTGMLRTASWLVSADSMAWSLDGRLPQGGRCSPKRDHKSCANCLTWALKWRATLLSKLSQRPLWDEVPVLA